MKTRVIAMMMVMILVLSGIAGCGSKDAESVPKQDTTEARDGGDNSDDPQDEDMKALEAIGDVEVDKGLFNVTLNIPADFIGEITQEELDKTVKEKGYKSAKLNADGSVTYVINKEQHKEMLEGVKKSIDEGLAEIVNAEDNSSITNVTANDDYTSFTITTKSTSNDDIGLNETFAALTLYMYGGMYGVFSGERVDNVHVDFVNEATGKVISSGDSKNMGNDEGGE
jgi:predicted small lipoprotein YifL